MSSQRDGTLAFFGATGGVTLVCLIHSLRAGYKCVALVRTPKRLQDKLSSQGLSPDQLANLTTLQGNAHDVTAVKRALTFSGPETLVSHIVTGLGGSPSLTFSIYRPLRIAQLDDPTICETAARTLITALSQIYTECPRLSSHKPRVTFVSTTGISRGAEDVPFAMRMLYHEVLHFPHVDKKKMEDLFRGNMESEQPVFSGIYGIRPTLLTESKTWEDAQGLQKVRAGTEDKPVMGYSIKRADVGHWIFMNSIHEENLRKKWAGQMISLAY